MKKLLLINSLLLASIYSAQTVTTFAGSGAQGSTDATGTSASFNTPYNVAVDLSENVYVADTYNNKIRKITPSGVVTTLAGSGAQGSTDATGNAASFNFPQSLTVDSSGNVYVADTYNNKIRKITPSGVVTTLAGSGAQGSTDATGNAASFYNPYGIAVDSSGNVYVADTYNNKIRKITPSGVVTTLAGSGAQGSTDAIGNAASFNYPQSVCADSSGNVYVADTGNQKIRKISGSGNVITIAGSGSTGNSNGQGLNASFSDPWGVAIDSSGNVYVADTLNYLIRIISQAGIVSNLAGTGLRGSNDGDVTLASFNRPRGIAVFSNGNIYIADGGNNKIRKISPLSLSTKEDKNYSNISIYPNPIKNLIYFSRKIKNTSLLNLEGRKIKENINGNYLDISSLPKGSYIISGTDENNQNFNKKIIKE